MKFRKESPNALRWRFEVGSVCTFTATKSRENMMGTVHAYLDGLTVPSNSIVWRFERQPRTEA